MAVPGGAVVAFWAQFPIFPPGSGQAEFTPCMGDCELCAARRVVLANVVALILESAS